MCNTPRYSESGACIGVQRCEEYVLLASDRDRLAGVVQGMEEQSKRNLEALNKENIVMRRQMERLIDERDALKVELEEERQRGSSLANQCCEHPGGLHFSERGHSICPLAKVREAADALAESVGGGSGDAAMLGLYETLFCSDNAKKEAMASVDPWAEITSLRLALCEYQLKYWTIQYKLSLFSIEGDA